MDAFPGFSELRDKNARLKAGFFVSDAYTSFCLYKGPMDLENYW